MLKNNRRSIIRMTTSVILCTCCVLTIIAGEVSLGEVQRKVQSQQPEILSLPRFGFFGFGDFQGKALKQKEGYFLWLMMDDTLHQWSGYTQEWKGGDSFQLRGFNTLAVTVEGAEGDSSKFDENKLMSWIIRYEGITGDEALICSDSTVWSSDCAFVGPVDATFEYPLPKKAIEKGAIKKIGITLVKGAKYKDVKIKAYFIRKR